VNILNVSLIVSSFKILFKVANEVMEFS